MANLWEKLNFEIKRARFDIYIPRLNPEFASAQLEWLNNRESSAKKRDLSSLDKALLPGAYPNSSTIEEIIHKKNYIEAIWEKYGKNDTEVIAVLERHRIDEILEAGKQIEKVIALPRKIKERAQNLSTFWETEGIELDAFEWLEIAEKVGKGSEIRDLLSEYGYDFEE